MSLRKLNTRDKEKKTIIWLKLKKKKLEKGKSNSKLVVITFDIYALF